MKNWVIFVSRCLLLCTRKRGLSEKSGIQDRVQDEWKYISNDEWKEINAPMREEPVNLLQSFCVVPVKGNTVPE